MKENKPTPRQLETVQEVIDMVYADYQYDDHGRVGIDIPLPRKIRKQIDRANKKARKKKNKEK